MISRFGVRRGACREAGSGLSRDPQETPGPSGDVGTSLTTRHYRSAAGNYALLNALV